MPTESIDFTMFSPPYDDLKAYDGYSFDMQKFLALQVEVMRLSKVGAVCVVVVNDAITHGNRSLTSFRYATAMQDHGWTAYEVLPWVKRSSPYITKCRMAQCWELVLCMSKGRPSFLDLPTKPNVRAGAVIVNEHPK